MNVQEAIKKRLKELNQIIKRYQTYIERQKNRLRKGEAGYGDHKLERSIERREGHLMIKLEVRNELENLLDIISEKGADS